MSGKDYALIAATGSLLLMLGAWGFEYAGYPPCQMCYWQRYPHFAAMFIGGLISMFPARFLALGGALATAITGGIGVYHAGVEQKWWAGPTSCTGGGTDLGAMSGADLLSTSGPGIVMCDEIAWSLMGVSMAGWNAIFSFLLCWLWITAYRRWT